MARSFNMRLVFYLITVTVITSIVILVASLAVSTYIMMDSTLRYNQSKLDYLSLQYNNSAKSSCDFLKLASDNELATLAERLDSNDEGTHTQALGNAKRLLSFWLTSENSFSDMYIVTKKYIVSSEGIENSTPAFQDPLSDASTINFEKTMLRNHIESCGHGSSWNRMIIVPVKKNALIAGQLKGTLLSLDNASTAVCIFDANHMLLYGEGISYTDIFDTGLTSAYSFAEPSPVPPVRAKSLLPRLMKLMGIDAVSVEGRNYLANVHYTYENGATFVLLNDIEKILSVLRAPTLDLCLLAACLDLVFMVLYFIAGRFAVKRITKLSNTVSGTNASDGISVLDAFINYNSKRTDIRRNITACFLLPFVPLSILVAFSFLLYTPVLMVNAKNEVKSTIEQAASTIEAQIHDVEGIAFRLANDDTLIDALVQIKPGEQPDTSAVTDALRRNGALSPAFRHIGLYDFKGNLLFSTDANTPQEIPKELQETSASLYLFDDYSDGTGQLWRAVHAGTQNASDQKGPPIGYIELGLGNMFYTADANSTRLANGYSYIYDIKKWALICTPLSTPLRRLAEGIAQGGLYQPKQLKMVTLPDTKEKQYFFYTPVDNGKWMYAYSFPASYITRSNYTILFYNLLLILVSLVVSAIMAWLMAHQIIHRIIKLASYCVDAKKNDTGFSRHWGSDEIGILAITFRDLLSHTKELVEQINRAQLEYYKLEHRKNELELITIQTKMNPHFLYNIFTSINVLLVSGENALASRMLNAAGKFMRLSLMGSEYEISLEKELEFAKSYIELEKMRYPDRFDVRLSYDPNFASVYMVPRLILQPLVENAILHALPACGSLSVLIEVQTMGSMVRISVCDDGIGMDDATIVQLNHMLETDLQTDHMGLACINERIKVYYGKEYGLAVQRPTDEKWRTRIDISLPLQAEEGESHVSDNDH